MTLDRTIGSSSKGRLLALLLFILSLLLAGGVVSRASGQPSNLPLGSLKPSKPVPSGAEFFKGAQYVGSKVCQQCHAKQYDEWQTTWHAKMTRKPSPDVIVGDFT